MSFEPVLARLHVGCGRNILPGWVNLDAVPLPGVEVVADLGRCREVPLPLPDDHFDEFLLSHVIEHLPDPLPMMQELWRVAKPSARMVIRCPHGGSDDAWEDPTHARPYFASSFAYFSQPFYWRADYGYRGDWQVEQITFVVDRSVCEGLEPAEVMARIDSQRNVVRELIAELTCIKPSREPEKALQRPPLYRINPV